MIPTRPIRVLEDQKSPGPVNVVRYSKSGDYCMTGGHDKCVRLWNPNSGQLVKEYAGHGWEVLSLDISADNSVFTSAGKDKAVFFWDVIAGKPVRRFHGHFQRVNCVAFNAEANLIFSGSYDASIRIWDCRDKNSKSAIQTLSDSKDSISSVIVHGSEIVAGCIDGKVRRYDVRTAKLITEDLSVPITCARYSHDQNCILVSTLDDTIRLLDKETGDILSQYQGHKNSKYKVESILCSQDSHVISGSEDGIVYIWDLVEESIVAKLIKHTRAVISLDYHPKEAYLLTSSSDGTVIMWGPDETNEE